MTTEPYFPLPPRLLDRAEQSDVVRWYLRLAIACVDDGSATTLANSIGVTPNTLHISVHRGTVTHDLAIRIEKYFGREYFPRELFTPEPDLPQE